MIPRAVDLTRNMHRLQNFINLFSLRIISIYVSTDYELIRAAHVTNYTAKLKSRLSQVNVPMLKGISIIDRRKSKRYNKILLSLKFRKQKLLFIHGFIADEGCSIFDSKRYVLPFKSSCHIEVDIRNANDVYVS